MKLNRIALSVILFFFLLLDVVFAKEPGQLHRRIKWLAPINISLDDREKINTPYFEKAAFNDNHLAFLQDHSSSFKENLTAPRKQ